MTTLRSDSAEGDMGRLQQVRTLYKSILRLHKSLPVEIRDLGNAYVKDEFKRHKKCSDHEAHIFMNEWIEYAFELAKQVNTGVKAVNVDQLQIGANIDPKLLEEMRDEQIAQLYELMKAAKLEDASKNG